MCPLTIAALGRERCAATARTPTDALVAVARAAAVVAGREPSGRSASSGAQQRPPTGHRRSVLATLAGRRSGGCQGPRSPPGCVDRGCRRPTLAGSSRGDVPLDQVCSGQAAPTGHGSDLTRELAGNGSGTALVPAGRPKPTGKESIEPGGSPNQQVGDGDAATWLPLDRLLGASARPGRSLSCSSGDREALPRARIRGRSHGGPSSSSRGPPHRRIAEHHEVGSLRRRRCTGWKQNASRVRSHSGSTCC